MNNSDANALIGQLMDNINSVVLGKPNAVRCCVVALLAGEHILIEDVPGVGKTLLGRAVAKSLHGRFCRIQFTPDLLPSDIVGASIFKASTDEFVFTQGPVFANIVLADEINRTPPRTQSAMLEAMSENQVSVDGHSHPLASPFMVIATQNPFEFEGTYPLPESQLDRFLMRISMGYPDRDHERSVLSDHKLGAPINSLESVVDCEKIVALQQKVREVAVDESIHDYLLDLLAATRDSHRMRLGASPRAGLSLYRAAQALALTEGRHYVIPDDIKQLCVPVLSHRILPLDGATHDRRTAAERAVRELIDDVPVPE